MNFAKIGTASFISFIFIGTIALFNPPAPEEDIQVYTEAVTAEPKAVNTTKYVSYDIPDGDTSFKSYMDYRAITNTDSKQYHLQQDAHTGIYGIRMYEDYYMIAVGSYYADSIGDILRITLDTDEQFYAIVGDFKADKDTDILNQYHPMEHDMKNVVEFIVDTQELNRDVRLSGSIGTYVKFNGNIKSIERVYQYE